MKKKIFLFIYLIQTSIILAQVSFYTKDIENKTNIPFVNITIVGENFGYTTDENGSLTIKENNTEKSLIFSAVGYKQKTIKIKDIKEVVLLEKDIYQLSEVRVGKKKNQKSNVVVSKGKLIYAFNNLKKDSPSLTFVAKYFAANYETPFIKTIKLKTDSYHKESVFNIRFYDVAENGSPKDLIYLENLFCSVKKNKHSNVIDVSNLNITIPEKGIFIAIEYLFIDKNKIEIEYDNKKGSHILYNPQLPMVKVNKYKDTWYNRGGEWMKYEIFTIGIELVLSN